MSTHCSTHFMYDNKVEGSIYRHGDGYPEDAGTDIYRFFAAVEAQCNGNNRFTDPNYLAAKYVVFLAGMFAPIAAKFRAKSLATEQRGRQKEALKNPLHFTGVGVLGPEDPNDIAYVYEVDCSALQPDGRPSVQCFLARDGKKLPDQMCEIPLPDKK